MNSFCIILRKIWRRYMLSGVRMKHEGDSAKKLWFLDTLVGKEQEDYEMKCANL
jgi:hypothetical protein